MGMKEEYEARRKKALAKQKEMKEAKRLRTLEIRKKALEGLKDQAYYKSALSEIDTDLSKAYDKKKSQEIQKKTKEDLEKTELDQLEDITGSRIGAKRRQKKLDKEQKK